MSQSGPALAVYNSRLYMVHRGKTRDDNLWFAYFNGTSWSTDTQLPNHGSADTPAIVHYRDANVSEDNYQVGGEDSNVSTAAQLIMVHRGHA